MPERQIVVNLRMTDGDALTKARMVKSALIDLKDEIAQNSKALRDNKKARKDLEKAQLEGTVTDEAAAASVRLLTNERERLKRSASDLSLAQRGLSVQSRELENDVGGLTDAGLRFRDKMAEANLVAIKQSGILGQLETRAQSLKDEQERLTKEFRDGVNTQKEYDAALAQSGQEQEQHTKGSRDAGKAQKEYDDAMAKTGQELAEIKEKEVALNTAVQRLNTELTEGRISVEQYRKSLSELSATQTQTTGSFNGFGDAFGKSFGTINDGKSALTGLVSNYIGIGAAVYGAARVIGDAIDTIKDFEQENANLASILGKTKEEITALTDSAIEIGPALARAPQEVTKLQTELAKLGFTEPQILAAQKAVIELANATGEDLATSAETAAGTLKAFGLGAEDTQRLVDVMATSFNTTSLDLHKFNAAMSTVAPVARAAGVSLEDTTAMIGLLADANIDASTVGTALRDIFIDLADKGISLEDALAQINGSTDKLTSATDLFGKRSATVALVMAENTDKAVELSAAFQSAEGSARKMGEVQLDTLDGSINQLSASWKGFILSLDSADSKLGRFVRDGIDAMGAFLNIFSGSGTQMDKLKTDSSWVFGSKEEREKLKGTAEELDRINAEQATFNLHMESGSKLVNLRTESLANLSSAIKEAREKEEAFAKQGKAAQAAEFAKTAAMLESIVASRQGIEAANQSIAATRAGTKATEENATATGTLAARKAELKKAIEAEQAAQEELAVGDTAGLRLSEQKIEALNNELNALSATASGTKKISEETTNAVGSVAALNAEVSKLTDLQSQSTDSAQFATYQGQIDKLKASIESITMPDMAVGETFDPLAAPDTVGLAGSTQEGPLPEDASIAQDAADSLALQREMEAEVELAAQAELIAVRNAAEVDGAVTRNEALAIAKAEFDAGVITSEEALAARRKEINKAYVVATVSAFGQLADALSGLAKEGSDEHKTLATISALVNTYLGFTAALSIPPPASFIAAAATLVSGFVAVKKIQGLDEGGFTERARSNKTPVGIVHANEWVAPAKMVQHPGLSKVFDWLEYVRVGGFKRPLRMPDDIGFETGGFVSLPSSLPSPSVGELLAASGNAEMRAKEFTAQISVSEINDVQNRVAVQEELSSA